MKESKTLTALGLSTYEADAYMALISKGMSNADEISKRAKIPYGRIYSVLNSLVGRDLVNVQNSRPKVFSPIEPKLALKRLLEAQKSFFDNEYSQLIHLAKEVEGSLNDIVPKKQDSSMFWTVAVEKGDVEQLNSQHFDEAQKEIAVFIGNAELHYEEGKNKFLVLYEKLEEAAKRNVRIRILFGFRDLQSLPALLEDASGRGVEILPHNLDWFRFVESTAAPFEIFDGERVFVKVGNPVNQFEFIAAIAVWDPKLAHELTSKFTQLWKKGKKLNLDLVSST